MSHEAVQVLAGEMPLDLILREDTIKFDVKRRGLVALPEELRQRIGEETERWRIKLREDSLVRWNRRWVTSEKGSTLRKFFPTVYSRLEAKWVHPDYWSSQILTGHGGFRAKLNTHGKNIDPRCPTCGVLETAEHVVMACTALDGPRAQLSRMTGMYVIGEEDLPRLMEEGMYPHFMNFVRKWREVVGPTHFTLGRTVPVGETENGGAVDGRARDEEDEPG